jgi:hypothetical protein
LRRFHGKQGDGQGLPRRGVGHPEAFGMPDSRSI